MKYLSLGILSLLSCFPVLSQDFTPLSAEANGLSRLKPDQVIFNSYDMANHNNWEPYIGVLGNSVFMIEANTYADDGQLLNQRYGLVFQPAAGGAHKEGDAFYADDGPPSPLIPSPRQDGNPGRVTGDTRPGAVNFLAGGEATLHFLPEFGSDDRWSLGLDRSADARYASVQAYSLNTSTLAQTPLCKAFDSINGRMTSGSAS